MNALWNTRPGLLLVSLVLATACGSSGGEDGSASGPDPSSSSGTETGDPTSSTGEPGSSSGSTEESSTGDASSSSGDGSSSGGSSESGSESDSTDTDPVAGCPDVPLRNIEGTLAIARGDLPDDEETSTDVGGSGEEPDPDELLLFIDSNDAITCEEPNGTSECETSWSATVVIPVVAQAPGVYEIGVDVDGYYGLTIGDGEECGGGAGSLEGLLEIVSIDENTVSARLCNTNVAEAPADGAFEASRC